MSILVIRTQKRYAVRRSARLRNAGVRAQDGLLIEISLEGCRISNIDDRAFSVGQVATVGIDGFGDLEAHVRWAHDGFVGLRFLSPLHMPALDRLIGSCRAEAGAPGELAACGS